MLKLLHLRNLDVVYIFQLYNNFSLMVHYGIYRFNHLQITLIRQAMELPLARIFRCSNFINQGVSINIIYGYIIYNFINLHLWTLHNTYSSILNFERYTPEDSQYMTETLYAYRIKMK
jgi:putative component of membrane protein insertase Oxa1/YidC/SpoIIIJ protein YidD